MDEEIKSDLHRIINHSVDMAEKLLGQQQGEFYPFGAAIEISGELKNIAYWAGEEHPVSTSVIEGLRNAFKERVVRKEVRSYAITYDALVRPEPHLEKCDTVTIDYFDTRNGQLALYYYPYKLDEDFNVVFGEPWAALAT
ncbi:hypothetical protein MUN81_18525 [Hymenobacter sp. 5317J-9]|uniref:hypothetical protein n=1 Tax=Hymenobacter sp. 5317J-9 TaxID=2932250 RepID=UPI001FD6C921|nr:hypothetical protein [Hymenobacter sp. 5317J-9]UOQ97221.1 hypothetical protein MUN81_18525 [Hymenobacter sp. 5317J-9]